MNTTKWQHGFWGGALSLSQYKGYTNAEETY